ncbi:hypothetical protein M8C21_017350 [Ambrosia artemisiifolia]|uniref:Rho termination factor N-terminal domain-containing protein n=1 Tax=Ambrosia artemisiifolia TaxID=4212 RepID=A0AAD5GFK1_AMBAR|nr:hypothetical protein M8C21_017350 [Ambrosia artemisiifolia]
MDGLWDPPHYQGSEDIGSFPVPYDVIEETAINEKSCIEVLEILTSKADADIAEHEEVLMDLLSQLACTDEQFSDMFVRCLTAKIDFLDSSIRKLKDDDEEFLSTRREPAESIYEILKSLFHLYSQNKDLQGCLFMFSLQNQKCAENNGTASTSCCPVPADNQKKQVSGCSKANQIEEIRTGEFTLVQKSACCQVPADNQKKPVGSSSKANQMEKIKTVNFTSVQKQTIIPTKVKVEEENADYPHTSPVRSLYWGSKNKAGREVHKFQIKSPIIMKKDILQNRTPRCSSICPKKSSETQGKQKHQLSIVKSQPYDESMSLATVPYDESINLPTVPCSESMSLATVPYDESISLSTVPCSESMSLATVPYDESMSLATVPYVESMSLETVSYDENMSLATVPYGESFEEINAMSLTTIPYLESHEEANVKQLIIQELDFPPGYQPQHHQKQSISRSRNLSSTRTYTRRKKPNSPLRTNSNSHLAVAVASTFDVERNYTVNDLRAIAKERNFKRFYKLRKAELAQLLGIKLSEGRGKQLKKADTQLVSLIKREPEFAAIGF